MRRTIAFYQNGNYTVRLFDDGTKVKKTPMDVFCAKFPDSIDLKITDYCDLGCPMCHERSSTSGNAGDLSEAFFKTLHPGTELAIGGGNPLSHPDLIAFLERMRCEGIVCNLTVSGTHLKRDRARIESLIDRRLIYGIGISITEPDEDVILFAEKHKNAVLHLIAGVFENYCALFDRGLKILILGYKRFGRGEAFYNTRVADNIAATGDILPTIVDKFDCISFDNLALDQLNVASFVPKEEYERMYMGDDGEASMYIDLVKREFARSSTSSKRYPLTSDVADMFRQIKV